MCTDSDGSPLCIGEDAIGNMNSLSPKETRALKKEPRGGNTEMGGERVPGLQAKPSEHCRLPTLLRLSPEIRAQGVSPIDVTGLHTI